jgi:hypothetical protein
MEIVVSAFDPAVGWSEGAASTAARKTKKEARVDMARQYAPERTCAPLPSPAGQSLHFRFGEICASRARFARP